MFNKLATRVGSKRERPAEVESSEQRHIRRKVDGPDYRYQPWSLATQSQFSPRKLSKLKMMIELTKHISMVMCEFDDPLRNQLLKTTETLLDAIGEDKS